MVRDLPPLNSLRAFEAAARRLSFTRAAEELGVTQAAISHHVRVLEDRLGFRLFRRLNNGLLLTEKGEAYSCHPSGRPSMYCARRPTRFRGTANCKS